MRYPVMYGSTHLFHTSPVVCASHWLFKDLRILIQVPLIVAHDTCLKFLFVAADRASITGHPVNKTEMYIISKCKNIVRK